MLEFPVMYILFQWIFQWIFPISHRTALLIHSVLPLSNNANRLQDSIPVDDDYWERSDLERFEWKTQRVLSPVSLEYILKLAATNG